jgi:soluble lytic murein transglycosylase-like protein
MSSEYHLTIRDYIDRAMGGRPRNKKGLSSTRTRSSAAKGFHQILTSRSAPRSTRAPAKSGGLKAADYLARPVHAKNKLKPRSAIAPGKKAIANTDVSAGHPALGESKLSAVKTAALSRPIKNDVSHLRAAGLRSLHRQVGTNEQQKIKNSILKAAQKYDLPVHLINGVIRAESNFQVKAVSHAGAQGLMQLMPDTARELGVKNPFNIEENIDGGSRYLRKMLDSFGGDLKLALAAYNAGPEAVIKYGGKVPPYRETQQYVNRVLRFAKQAV